VKDSRVTARIRIAVVALFATSVLSACAHQARNALECSRLPPLEGSATVAYAPTQEPRSVKISITNAGRGPLCFFARDRLFASELFLYGKNSEEIAFQYPDTDRPWDSPLNNRFVCIPPGPSPVSQDFDVRIGVEIEPLPVGEHRLAFNLIAFSPYMLSLAKPGHSIGNGIREREFSCGVERAILTIRAETAVRIE
jgi:hypothetical protein